MVKKILWSMAVTLLMQSTFANNCPSVQDVKNNKIAGWKAFDSEDGTPLSGPRETQFKQNVEEFALAEWANNNKNGSIHCYYKDKTGSDLEAYLTKNNFILKSGKSYWYEVSGSMQCAAGAKNCEFQENALNPSSQLAKR